MQILFYHIYISQIELNDLKRFKNTSTPQSKSIPLNLIPAQPKDETPQHILSPLLHSPPSLAQAFSHSSSTQFETLLQSKKDKIKNLKTEIESLQVENASLKAQINKLQQHKPNENENNDNNNIL